MRPPRFWEANLDLHSRQAATITRKLLTPFALAYDRIVAYKIERANPFSCGVPVICVGNLTVGGSGKTPFVKWIRSYLSSKGGRVASLSRGYGGTLRGPLRVDYSNHSAKQVGDEPLMLSKTGETWIGANRPIAANTMVEDGAKIIVMDDGHQNPTLLKDLTFVVIDSENPFGNGYVFPKGPLRENIRAGLSRADAIVLMGKGTTPTEIADSDIPIYRCQIVAKQPDKSSQYVAFAGIGRPEKFFDTLAELELEIADAIPFPDHHNYSKSDLTYLSKLAQENQARLITTEKDYVRLTSDIKKDVEVLETSLAIENSNLLETLLEPILETVK